MNELLKPANQITLARALFGLIGAFLLLEGRHVAVTYDNADLAGAYTLAAAIIFFIAALSDWLDGWVARRTGTQSALGALLDPIADKVLVNSYLIAYVIITDFSVFIALPVAVMVLRDVIVTGLRLQDREAPVVQVSAAAKFKTALQMIITAAPFILFMVGFRDFDSWGLPWLICVWAVAVLTIWTAIPYVRAARTPRG
jgi:CDP-diacylglycerol--glycerol-3-phosphate 3-phosphatidyltransferase